MNTGDSCGISLNCPEKERSTDRAHSDIAHRTQIVQQQIACNRNVDAQYDLRKDDHKVAEPLVPQHVFCSSHGELESKEQAPGGIIKKYPKLARFVLFQE